MSLILSALRARLAMQRGARHKEACRLIERLEDSAPGSPMLRFGWGTPGDREERLASGRSLR